MPKEEPGQPTPCQPLPRSQEEPCRALCAHVLSALPVILQVSMSSRAESKWRKVRSFVSNPGSHAPAQWASLIPPPFISEPFTPPAPCRAGPGALRTSVLPARLQVWEAPHSAYYASLKLAGATFRHDSSTTSSSGFSHCSSSYPQVLPYDLWAPLLLGSLLSGLLSEDWPLLTSAGSEIRHVCPVNCHKRRFLPGSAAVGTRHCKAFSLDEKTGPTLDVQGEWGRDI